MRRAPWKVLLTAVLMIILVPLTLPFLILAVSVFQPVLKCMGIKQVCGLDHGRMLQSHQQPCGDGVRNQTA